MAKLAQALQTEFKTKNLGVIQLYSSATIRSQTKLLSGHLEQIRTSRQPSVEHPVRSRVPRGLSPASEQADSRIAIVGIAGRFPGANTPEELYQLFVGQREGFTKFPAPAELPFKEAIFIPYRGAISEVDYFDHDFWGIKEDEARCESFSLLC